MATIGQSKCLCCNSFFDPDRRSRNRQLYFANSLCRIARKAKKTNVNRPHFQTRYFPTSWEWRSQFDGCPGLSRFKTLVYEAFDGCPCLRPGLVEDLGRQVGDVVIDLAAVACADLVAAGVVAACHRAGCRCLSKNSCSF